MYMTTCVNVYIHLIDKCVLLYNYQCGHSFQPRSFSMSLFFAHFKVLLIINLLNNYAHLMYLCNKCCIGTYYL